MDKVKNKKGNIKKIKTTEKKTSYSDLTVSEIEQELTKEKYKSKYVKVLMSTLYTLIIVASVAALIATFVMPVLQISGSSMSPTLHEGEIVVSVKTKKFDTSDVIAFYHGNKILVKRVVAQSGDWVNITDNGNVYIDEKLLDEPYIEKKSLGNTDIDFPYQVPESTYFVLGDDRETSIDSRNTIIGTIKEENIIGKVIFKVWPMNHVGIIK